MSNEEVRNVRLSPRLATRADLGALRTLMEAAIAELQKPFLDARQIEASRMIMGLDTQLIEDGTYFCVEVGGQVAGCGGWSRRATLYGGDRTPGRNAELLDPRRDPARVRAMYTHPDYARRGIGRLILSLCEGAALSEGFSTIELMATMAGEPFTSPAATNRSSGCRTGAADCRFRWPVCGNHCDEPTVATSMTTEA